MAEMHPDTPLKGARSSGERKVYFALQENLPAAYTVLHSVPLLSRPRDAKWLLDREVDFVVCHPAYGLLAIEVKGGGIRCNAQNQQWTSISADGQEHVIKNPYEQARRNLYTLLDELNESKLTRRYSFPAGFAVWFPDVELASTHLAQGAGHREITLDATTLRQPETEFRRLFRECLVVRAAGVPPSAAGVEGLVRLFVPAWELPVRWRTSLAEEEETLVRATRSQHKVLSMLGRKKRALICGSAGSGKTFLAVEKARRLAMTGLKVLLVCYNQQLAEWLRIVTLDTAGISVFSYHALCFHLCEIAGFPKPKADLHGDRNQFFRYELPEMMLEALEIVELRFDAILVDEAQDFEAVWWIGLEQLLRDPAENSLYLFYDDNQHIYGTRIDFPIDDTPLVLCENCRNTQTIFAGVMEYYRGDSVPEPIGPAGRPIEVIETASDAEEQCAVTEIIRRLLVKEGIAPGAVTILTARAQKNSRWWEGMPITTGVVVSWTPKSVPGAVACSTIHSFKGLENSVIIVTEIAHAPEKTQRELLYVACSRAKFHLVICLQPPAALLVDSIVPSVVPCQS